MQRPPGINDALHADGGAARNSSSGAVCVDEDARPAVADDEQTVCVRAARAKAIVGCGVATDDALTAAAPLLQTLGGVFVPGVCR